MQRRPYYHRMTQLPCPGPNSGVCRAGRFPAPPGGWRCDMGDSKSAVMDGLKLFGYAGPIDRTAIRAGRGRWSLKQVLIAGGAALSIAAAAGYGNYYWRTGRF